MLATEFVNTLRTSHMTKQGIVRDMACWQNLKVSNISGQRSNNSKLGAQE